MVSDWHSILSAADINETWSGIKDRMVQVTDKLCPNKWMTVIKNKPAWLTNELMDLGRERDKLFQIYRRSKKTGVNIYNEAVKKRCEFNRLSKTFRENFFREQLLVYKDDQSKFWKKVYELIGNPSGEPIERVFKYGCLNRFE